jgi:phage-related protein
MKKSELERIILQMAERDKVEAELRDLLTIETKEHDVTRKQRDDAWDTIRQLEEEEFTKPNTEARVRNPWAPAKGE